MAARRKATTDKPSVGAKYLVLVDVYYDNKHVAAGETVTDIPDKSISWLLAGEYIRKVN